MAERDCGIHVFNRDIQKLKQKQKQSAGSALSTSLGGVATKKNYILAGAEADAEAEVANMANTALTSNTFVSLLFSRFLNDH